MFRFCFPNDHEGKQLVAALALGAIGVNLGTRYDNKESNFDSHTRTPRFCATKECLWPSSFKQAMIDATEEDSVLLFRNLHNTARVFKNKTAAEGYFACLPNCDSDEICSAAAIEKEKGVQIQFGDIAHLVAGTRGRAAEAKNDKDGGIW